MSGEERRLGSQRDEVLVTIKVDPEALEVFDALSSYRGENRSESLTKAIASLAGMRSAEKEDPAKDPDKLVPFPVRAPRGLLEVFDALSGFRGENRNQSILVAMGKLARETLGPELERGEDFVIRKFPSGREIRVSDVRRVLMGGEQKGA